MIRCVCWGDLEGGCIWFEEEIREREREGNRVSVLGDSSSIFTAHRVFEIVLRCVNRHLVS